MFRGRVQNLTGSVHDGVGAAHPLDGAGGRGDRRERVQVGRVGVEPAEIALVHGLHVVVDGAVVAPHVVLAGQLGQLGEGLGVELLGDLGGGQAVVGQPHGLVVQPPVQVALLDEEGPHVVGTEARPVVAGEADVGVVGEQVDGLVDVPAPRQRVPHLGPAQRVEVVHRVGAVLGHAQQAQVGEVEVHLRRGLGARGQLEHDADPVEDPFGAGLVDLLGRRDEAHRAERGGLAEAGVDLTLGTDRQQRAVHVHRPTHHGRPGDHVLATPPPAGSRPGRATWHRPASTSAADVTPSTPAKWSMWEWV